MSAMRLNSMRNWSIAESGECTFCPEKLAGKYSNKMHNYKEKTCKCFVLIFKNADTTQPESFGLGCVRDVEIWFIDIPTNLFSIFCWKLCSNFRVPILCPCCTDVEGGAAAFTEAMERHRNNPQMQKEEVERLRLLLERHVTKHLDIRWDIASQKVD